MSTNNSPVTARRWALRYAALALTAAAFLSSCSKDRPETPAPAVDAAARTADVSVVPRAPYAIPDTLKAPAGAPLLASVFGQGVQIYEVRALAADPNRFEWAFVASEATLYGTDNFVVGRHYGGPTWESNDRSTVVGRVLVRRDAPYRLFNIPWLLLASRANTGTGIFSRVAYVQRLNTWGGQAPPAVTATRATLGRQVRIPYTSTYLFYGAVQ